MMKLIIAVLVLMLLGLQYRLWVGEGSMAHRVELQDKIELQEAENDTLRERNRILAMEVEALKTNLDAVEERAREQMGMIKQDETFFMIVDSEEKNKSSGAGTQESQ
jgi:cell division protein FtsB